jgi:hypothetical protein
MNCKQCDSQVVCLQHGAKDLIEEKDPDDLEFYYCGECLGEYGSPLGSIIHHCVDPLGLFG